MVKLSKLGFWVQLLGVATCQFNNYPFRVSSIDPSSYANVEVIQTTNFDLDITVDFNQKSVYGTNLLSMKALRDTSEIILDTQGIIIKDAWYSFTNDEKAVYVPANYETYIDKQLGTALRIYLTDKIFLGDLIFVKISYQTTTDSTAINWLTKEQTASKTLAYMFTECQPINCRSFAPLQDTPSVRATYTSKVTVDQPYVVNMSANFTQMKVVNTNQFQYSFAQPIPIPSYLLAISIGNLISKRIGTRTSVITEPTTIVDDAKELQDLNTLLQLSEDYMGTYIWGSYTIIVQPPSFPIGGMENPLLTFASPTIIVGDGSQVYVATHEIGHSWTGNEVTCRDWSNFWLNEGFTVFIERHVSAGVHGPDFSKLGSQLGNQSAWDDMNGYGLSNSYSSLYPIMNGQDPEISSSEVPYEKGFQFLKYLENQMDKPADFQAFLRYYVHRFHLQSVTFLELRIAFKDFITTLYPGDKGTNLLAKVNWVGWVQTPGAIPKDNGLDFTTDAATKMTAMANFYIDNFGQQSPTNIEDYTKAVDPQIKTVFQNQLLSRQSDVTYDVLDRIDKDLNTTLDINPEIGQRWFPLCIAVGYDKCLDAAHKFVGRIGRQKYILPIYQNLVRYGKRNLAYQWFKESQTFYHPITAKKILNIILSSAENDKVVEKQISKFLN
ncbi:peptidase family m1 containing protein [Stylonychia lemnae]|uniref:Peptidase family m1 containing protein n=1 Tax=Stylonychia lemnae TaxID=5949 RepID=A0A078AEQ5_STYLE|nr:peptidase family m1 containing protein [Stylonychia lemnae]|eukprot:CDW80710.1 peptidase family m1 containing protein [Stylonychia lemnae]